MYESYRVRRKFQWNGWIYCPPGPCDCDCGKPTVTVNPTTGAETLVTREKGLEYANCSGVVATGCTCPDSGYCGCSIPKSAYGGDIWLVEENHPRKEYILLRRFAIYDHSLGSGDDLIKDDKYKRLLGEPPLPKTKTLSVATTRPETVNVQ